MVLKKGFFYTKMPYFLLTFLDSFCEINPKVNKYVQIYSFPLLHKM